MGCEQVKDNRLMAKIAFIIVASLVCLGLGMLFPGIAHVVLAASALIVYRQIFGQ